MAFTQGVNPIKTVDGVSVPCPSAYQWKLEDVSASDAGRTEDVTMDKKRIGQVVGVELSWSYLTIAEAATVLKAFNPEYVMVNYLDAMQGDFVTKEFYVGNRSAPLYSTSTGRWENISFNLIARRG